MMRKASAGVTPRASLLRGIGRLRCKTTYCRSRTIVVTGLRSRPHAPVCRSVTNDFIQLHRPVSLPGSSLTWAMCKVRRCDQCVKTLAASGSSDRTHLMTSNGSARVTEAVQISAELLQKRGNQSEEIPMDRRFGIPYTMTT